MMRFDPALGAGTVIVTVPPKRARDPRVREVLARAGADIVLSGRGYEIAFGWGGLERACRVSQALEAWRRR